MKRLDVHQTTYRDYSKGPGGTLAKQYKVIKVANAVHPCVGDTLTVAEIHDFCDSNDWEVEIT